MPYLDSKIEKHHKGCINPVGKRLYIRDYDDNGKQKFVSWGLTCTTCGVVVKGKYERNLTKQERWKLEFGLKKLNDKEYLNRQRAYKIKRKLERIQRRKIGKDPMTPQESGLRTRIKNFKVEESDQNIVEQFLYLSPRPTVRELIDVVYPLGWDPHKHKNCIPDPEKSGYLKYDLGRWKKDPKTGEIFKWNDDPNFVSDYEKLLKQEAQKRIELMKQIIKSREVKENK
jgi:hypothetical protein